MRRRCRFGRKEAAGRGGRRVKGKEGSLPFCSRGTGGNIRWGRRSEWSRTGLHLKIKDQKKENKKSKQMTDVNTVTQQYLHNKRNQG